MQAGLECVDSGRVIGRFRLCERIGESRTFEVYRAQRIADFPQTVALKLPRSGVGMDAAIVRLREEREALAPLHHPGIAALIDFSFEPPTPWLAAEFVDGPPLDRYCEQHSLAIRQRVELVREVLLALVYAHQRLIVHGGLCFRHVLVDAEGRPRLIGFGPASDPVAPPAEDAGLSFAPPEKLSGQPLTTAADVYSAGAMLLAGTYPFQKKRGDLDAILRHAMAAQPEDRYPSAEALAADLDNYLRGMPVEARNGGWFYRLRKFAARNRAVAAATAVLLVILLGCGVIVANRAVQAARARAQAEQRLGDMQRLTGSLLGEFSNDLSTLPGSAPLQEMLLRRTGDTLDQLAQQEGKNPALAEELARDYLQLGELYARLPGDGRQAAMAAARGLAILEAARTKRKASSQRLDLEARLSRLRGQP